MSNTQKGKSASPRQCPRCPHTLSDFPSHTTGPTDKTAIESSSTVEIPESGPSVMTRSKVDSLEKEPIDKQKDGLPSQNESILGSMGHAGVKVSDKVYINRQHPTHIDIGQTFKAAVAVALSSTSKVSSFSSQIGELYMDDC